MPLVPKNRLSVSLDLLLPRGVAGRLDVLRVGEQVLSNDDANAQQRLDGYKVLNARLSWRPGEARRPRTLDSLRAASAPPGAGFLGAVELFVEGRNLLDETYATRGIYAFNFDPVSPANVVFVTPAPGRTFTGGISLTF